jgi:hypothetical protein
MSSSIPPTFGVDVFARRPMPTSKPRTGLPWTIPRRGCGGGGGGGMGVAEAPLAPVEEDWCPSDLLPLISLE